MNRTIVFGDIQGHYTIFKKLLNSINFNPHKDKIYLLGDIINRGPESLEMLEWVYENQNICSTIIGNHELHLIRCFEGIAKIMPGDTIDPILNSPRIKDFIFFLYQTPLIRFENNLFMVHAGINPKLSLEQNNQLAGIGKSWKKLNQEQIKYYTYLRYLDKDGKIIDDFKGPPSLAPDNIRFWPDLIQEDFKKTILLFGHFAALGLYKHQTKNIICLDSGLVWGKVLSCFIKETNQVYQINHALYVKEVPLILSERGKR